MTDRISFEEVEFVNRTVPRSVFTTASAQIEAADLSNESSCEGAGVAGATNSANEISFC